MQIGSTIRGTFISEVVLPLRGDHSGMAVSQEGHIMAFSNYIACKVFVFIDGVKSHEFGREGDGPGELKRPMKMCFTPSGNLLIAEDTNRRLQEVTITGDHVRYIGTSVYTSDGFAVAISRSGMIIAASGRSLDSKDHIHLFDFDTGFLLRSFGRPSDSIPVREVWGMRFSPDDTHICVTNQSDQIVVMLDLQGNCCQEFKREGLRAPRDVDFASNGDVMIAYLTSGCVTVYSPDGAFLRSIDCGSVKFDCPNALAVHAGRLYVMCRNLDKVQAFE